MEESESVSHLLIELKAEQDALLSEMTAEQRRIHLEQANKKVRLCP